MPVIPPFIVRANPKSHSFNVSLLLINKFSGLISERRRNGGRLNGNERLINGILRHVVVKS